MMCCSLLENDFLNSFYLQVSELIQLLETLQSAASADAATRREIAQFPPEVSDPNKAMEIMKSCKIFLKSYEDYIYIYTTAYFKSLLIV